jgi:hypothetical protein
LVPESVMGKLDFGLAWTPKDSSRNVPFAPEPDQAHAGGASPYRGRGHSRGDSQMTDATTEARRLVRKAQRGARGCWGTTRS